MNMLRIEFFFIFDFQGRSMVETASQTFRDKPHLASIKQAITTGEIQWPHLAVMYGSICGILGIDIEDVYMMYLFNAMKTAVASSVRLGLIGAMEVSM